MFNRRILMSLFAAAAGALFKGTPVDDPNTLFAAAPSSQAKRSRTPYSRSGQNKRNRFEACKRGCRPPARRHYRPLGNRGFANDIPKRLKDRIAWARARRY